MMSKTFCVMSTIQPSTSIAFNPPPIVALRCPIPSLDYLISHKHPLLALRGSLQRGAQPPSTEESKKGVVQRNRVMQLFLEMRWKLKRSARIS